MTLTVRFTFDDRFKVTSAKYFDPDFNLLSCELDNLVFKVLSWVILYGYIKVKQIQNTFAVFSEKIQFIFVCLLDNEKHCYISISI